MIRQPCSKSSVQDNTDGTIKMNCNPSYEGFEDSNTDEYKSDYELTIQPSCSSKFSAAEDQRHTKPESQMVEYQEYETVDYI